jgi:transcriptional regulator with XRE-family HTH domain
MLEPDRQRQERKNLAETLRALRKAAGLSGERLAARCSMSQSKISRIEQGKILPTVVDVQQMLIALEVPDEVARGLVDLARTANVHYKSYRAAAQAGLWRLQSEIKSLAGSSTAVRQFLPAMPSGLLQTEQYAREALTQAVEGGTSRDVERSVAARLDSQEVLRDESRRFLFLMPEHSVRWRRASPQIMAGQCAHMAEMSARLPNIEIAIIPQSVQVSKGSLHTFIVYDERMVKIELFSGGIVFRDPKDVAYHLSIFEFFWEHALTGDDATTLLLSIADDFMRELD